MNIHKFFAGGGKVDEEKLGRVARAVQKKETPVSPKQLAKETQLSKTKVAKAIQRLEDAGAVVETPEGNVAAVENATNSMEAAHAAKEDHQRRHNAELKRMEDMRNYAEGLGCRRAAILRYFGEEGAPNCGNCDNCLGKGAAAGGGIRREVA